MYVMIYEEDYSRTQELDDCVMGEGKGEDGKEKGWEGGYIARPSRKQPNKEVTTEE